MSSGSRVAITGNRRDSAGDAVSSSVVKVTYEELFFMSEMLISALYDKLGVSGEETLKEDEKSAGDVVVAGVGIPASSPLFALCCFALHVTHDERCFVAPLAMTPLDTEDPPERSKHMLRCLTPTLGKDMNSGVCNRHCGLGIILTSGESCVQHWKELIQEVEKDYLSASHQSCGVMDVEAFIRDSTLLSSRDKKQWLWDEESVIDDVNLFGTKWDDDEGDDDEDSDEDNDDNVDDNVSDLKILQNRISRGTMCPVLDIQDSSHALSHISFTSGTSAGAPKACCASYNALVNYCNGKNAAHGVSSASKVLLVSAATFDPALGDVIATLRIGATLVLATRSQLQMPVGALIQTFNVTHLLGTPSWFTHTDLMTDSMLDPNSFPTLKVIALGGERIPTQVIKKWSRDFDCEGRNTTHSPLRLCVTYGVTEACVYQTFGEVYKTDAKCRTNCGLYVGQPLDGIGIDIDATDESLVIDDDGDTINFESCDDSRTAGAHVQVGEIILKGSLIDDVSGYFNFNYEGVSHIVNPFRRKASVDGTTYVSYHTGDMGYLSCDTKKLYLVGRISSAPRLLKLNGIRVDPLEIEDSILDENTDFCTSPLVKECAVVVDDCNSATGIECFNRVIAYCTLSKEGLAELGTSKTLLSPGLVCNRGPLLTLLRARCQSQLKHGVVPPVFIIVENIPMSCTGKRQLGLLPKLSLCNVDNEGSDADLLSSIGGSGPLVAATIISSLNLQPCQYSMVTTKASFALLGCDSLAVTRIVRCLYASHYGIFNSRHLGGKFGVLDEEGPFAARHAFQAPNLGEYVSWLDSHNVCQGTIGDINVASCSISSRRQEEMRSSSSGELLYDCLIEAIVRRQNRIALALLALEIDPSFSEHGGRLAKVPGRLAMRQLFKSNPLHLSCVQGEPSLVKVLISQGFSCMSPDANGAFPLHLVCLNPSANSELDITSGESVDDVDEKKRIECIQHLLEFGKVPLPMKDGNKQTILHRAARMGNTTLTKYVIDLWKEGGISGEVPSIKDQNGGGIWDWYDRWHRTPVHWAVLNGHIETLELLLIAGCNPHPHQSKRLNRSTSAEDETPLEICERKFLRSNCHSQRKIGEAIELLLNGTNRCGKAI